MTPPWDRVFTIPGGLDDSDYPGNTLLTGQGSKTVEVWKKRREPTRWDALALWEYLLIHGIAIAAVCGLLMRVGRRTRAETGRRLFGTAGFAEPEPATAAN